MDQRPPSKSLPAVRAGPFLPLERLHSIVNPSVSAICTAHTLHNTCSILRYSLDVALDQVGLGTVLLLVAKQSRPTLEQLTLTVW